MPYQHGVRVLEQATSIVAPILGTAGLQVVFGTAPINLADDPYKVTNTPLIAYSWAEAVKQLGYSADYKNYTLCEAMYASFQLIGVAPVIFINVLDPKKHKKKNEAATVPVEEMEAVVPITGILKDTVTVKMKGADEESEDTPLGFETDYAENDDVPNLSPSNKLIGATGTVLATGEEVLLDQVQGNAVNSFGVTTAINVNGWRTWGNNSAVYPASTDPKDRWFCCRRFFSWWGNSFILTYFQKVDNPMNPRLIETIVDSENIRGASYVSQGKCARAEIVYNADENPVTDLLNGKITFHQYLTPYPPAEDILNILEFDPNALSDALGG